MHHMIGRFESSRKPFWEIEEESSDAKFQTGTILENKFLKQIGHNATRFMYYFVRRYGVIHSSIIFSNKMRLSNQGSCINNIINNLIMDQNGNCAITDILQDL